MFIFILCITSISPSLTKHSTLSFYLFFVVLSVFFSLLLMVKITRQLFGSRRRAHQVIIQQLCQPCQPRTTTIMLRRAHFQNLAQNQPSESQNQTQASYLPQQPRKENAPEHTEVDLAQVAIWQAQLEGMVKETNQTVHTIKQLLERMVIPPTQPTPRLRYAVEVS